MAIEGIRGPGGYGGEDRFAQAQEALRRLGTPGDKAAGKTPPAQRSSEVGRLEPGVIVIRFPAERATGVRAEKVREAQARIARGYYDLPEVRSSLAETLLDSFGLED
jgi:hypothetical protein